MNGKGEQVNLLLQRKLYRKLYAIFKGVVKICLVNRDLCIESFAIS